MTGIQKIKEAEAYIPIIHADIDQIFLSCQGRNSIRHN